MRIVVFILATLFSGIAGGQADISVSSTAAGSYTLVTTDSFSTFIPSRTPAEDEIVFRTTTGSLWQYVSGNWTRRSMDNGDNATFIYNVNNDTLTWNANLYNLVRMTVPNDSTDAHVSRPDNLTSQTVGEIITIGILADDVGACTVTWDTIFQSSDFTDLGSTTMPAGALKYYRFRYLVEGVGKLVLEDWRLMDGDKGDIDVTSSGTSWTVDTNSITYVKLASGLISNDPTLADSSTTQIVTEAAVKAYADTKGVIDSLVLLQDSILVAYDFGGSEVWRDTLAFLTAEVDGSVTNELATFTASSGAPGSPKQGDVWWKNTTDSTYIYNSGMWEFLAIRAGGGGAGMLKNSFGSIPQTSATVSNTNASVLGTYTPDTSATKFLISFQQNFLMKNPSLYFQAGVTVSFELKNTATTTKRVFFSEHYFMPNGERMPTVDVSGSRSTTVYFKVTSIGGNSRMVSLSNHTGPVMLYGTETAAYDYQLGAHSIMVGDTIWSTWIRNKDHLLQTDIDSGGVVVAAFDRFGKTIIAPEFVRKDYTSSPDTAAADCIIGNLGNGRRVIFYNKYKLASGHPRFRDIYFKIREANGTYSAEQRVNGRYVSETTNGWMTPGSFINAGAQGWLLCAYGWQSATNNTNSYDVFIMRSTDQGVTWTNTALVGNGAFDSDQYEEPWLMQLSNGRWACFIRNDNGAVIQFTSTKSATDTITWPRPDAGSKFNGRGRCQVLEIPEQPGKLIAMTRNWNTTPTFPTQFGDYESVYYVSENYGETWAGPHKLDLYRQGEVGANPYYMYGTPVQISPGVIGFVWAEEYGGGGGYSNLMFRKFSVSELTANTKNDQLFLSKIHGKYEQYYPYSVENNLIGVNAGNALTTGQRNNMLGNGAGALTTTGSNNNFIGTNVGAKNTTGFENIMIGRDLNTVSAAHTGNNNIVLGRLSFANATSAFDNIVIANSLGLYNCTTCSNNVIIGEDAGRDNVTGNSNTYIGTAAGLNNTGGQNTIVGRYSTGNSWNGIAALANGVGTNGLAFLWTGTSKNIFMGNAGNLTLTGSRNYYWGAENGTATTSGSDNIFLGEKSGKSNTSGSNNIFLNSTNVPGKGAGENNTSGSNNVFLGYGAGSANTTGSKNVAIGWNAGSLLTTGSNNVCLGFVTSGLNSWRSNTVAIADMAGNAKIYADSLGRVGIGTLTPDASAILDVSSTVMGFLQPRMTTTQRNAITSPAMGLSVYNTTTNYPNFYDGTTWRQVASQTFTDENYWKIGGTTNTLTSESNIGSANAFGFNIRTNAINRLRFDPGGRIFTSSSDVTDFIISATDTAEIGNSNAKWQFAGTTAKLGLASTGLIHVNTGNGDVGLEVTPASAFHIGSNRIGSHTDHAGYGIRYDDVLFTNNTTAPSGSAIAMIANSLGQPTMGATNTGVTTTNAATLYIKGEPLAGTNNTITNSHALWIDNGTCRFDGQILGTTAGFYSNPQYGFNGAPTWGMKLSTSRLRFLTDNTDALTIDATQKVYLAGIAAGNSGTPTFNLAMGSGGELITTPAFSGTPILDGFNPTSSGFLQIGSDDALYGTGIYSNGGDSLRMTIQNTGGYSYELQNNATSAYRIYDSSSGGIEYFKIDTQNGDVEFEDANLVIGTTSAHASAAIDITSTTQGFLPPRMTSTQRDAISSPATGLTIFCTDCTANDASTGVMQSWNGTSWKNYW